MPKEPRHIQRLVRRLKREGRVEACYEAGVSGYDLYRHIGACQLRRHRGGTASPGWGTMWHDAQWATHGGCCKTRPSAVFEHDPREETDYVYQFVQKGCHG